jgi:hypothetical protein
MKFIFNVEKPYSLKIKIPVPKEFESRLFYKYFYNQITDKLNVPINKILINGQQNIQK